MFAKLSIIELRAQQGICSASCTTYQCYKGGPQKGEGMETGGCPVYSHPAQLQDNRNCVLCMTCLKACPHRSVELNLRPPGMELWTTHEATASEVCLLFLLFGAVFLHRLPEIGLALEPLLQKGFEMPLLESWTTGMQIVWVHLAMSVAALLIPGAIAHFAYFCIRRLNPKPKSFVELAYGYLPLVLMANLAHYFRLGLTEAGQIIPVTLATFGYSGVGMPVAIAHPAVIAFLQGVALLTGAVLSVVLTQKIAKQSWRNLWPQHLATGAIAFLLWQIIVG